MPLKNEKRFVLPAWGISLAAHGAAVWLALAFTAQLKPVLQQEVFKWDVALVESAEVSERVESVTTPSQPQARVLPAPPVKSPQEPIHRVEPQQKVQMVHPAIDPVKPIEDKVDVPPSKAEPLQPIEQKVVAEPPPKVEPVVEAKQAEPVQRAEPVTESPSAALTPPAEPVAAQPSQHDPPTPASMAAPSHESLSQKAGNDAPAMPEAPVQVAQAPASSSEAKTDHRWLAESLWRRVAELKRYPASARLNGQEGKVILKAVIRSDGHLAEVSVQKSSGHTILDTAAIEAVKLACPLQMKHAINKPEIVVSLPIIYSLVN